jgi:hypothetical protein
MLHLICILVAVGAAAMPDTALPPMLDMLAAGLALTACLTLMIFKDAVTQARERALKLPDPRLHLGGWIIILVAASMVHWFPLACFVFVFVVETAFYARVRDGS